MRGFLQPSVKANQTETQKKLRGLSRTRRAKVAKSAQTTLVKADQWARGEDVGADLSEALDRALASLGAKKK